MDVWGEESRIDRALGLRGDVSALAQAWARPDALLLEVDTRGGLPVADGALAWQRCEGALPDDAWLLGTVGGAPRFGRTGGVAGTNVREVGLGLAPAELELAITAIALGRFHATAPYCSRCGHPTTAVPGGFSRRCDGCGAEHFPRHDPAMIVAVVDDDDRLLLAHQASWAPERLSVLAGFLEVGESLEHCVRREVMEEVGIHLGEVRYVASQPWPFPRSFMLACEATAASTAITVDGVEIEHAAFYDRDQVREQVARGNILLGSPSVSAWLVQRWLSAQ